MDMVFGSGKLEEIDKLEQLYNDLNDYLEKGINYPGWKKDIYPARQTAIDGISNGTLFTVKHNGKIVGSVILNHEPESAYYKASWQFESDYSDVFVIHTFVVHPDFLKCGIGNELMNFSIDHSIQHNANAIRLDVYEGNTPAIRLYEKFGFTYIDTVDLGLGEYGLHWFKLYEKLLQDI